MPGPTNELEQAILNHIFGKATYTPPTNWFVGVSTTTPSDDGSGFTEPAGGSYARVSTAASDWGTASGTAPAALSNSSVITFPAATADWGTVTYFGLFEAATGGTPKITGSFPSPGIAVGSGQTLEFAAGTIRNLAGDPSDTFA